MDQSEASIYYLAIVTHNAQGTDGVVQSPETVIAVKYLQDASEGEGQAKEHDAVLATCLMGALQQPEAIPHQLCQGVVREAERRNEDVSLTRVILFTSIFSPWCRHHRRGSTDTGKTQWLPKRVCEKVTD